MKKFFRDDGKLIGTLFDDGIFRKVVSVGKHLYKNDDAWGIDAHVIDSLKEETEIRIKDDKGTVYSTTVQKFKYGSRINFRNHGEQIVFWRPFFDRIEDGERIPSKDVDQWIADLNFFNSYIPTYAYSPAKITNARKPKIVRNTRRSIGNMRRETSYP